MANYKQLIPTILKWEGGWANDSLDRGGMTMKGITMDSYKTFCQTQNRPIPTPSDLQNISEDEWSNIFKTMYWDRWKADQIQNQSIANILVDWVWASGVWGVKIPQRLLGVVEDGIVGSQTITALNRQNPAEFFAKVHAKRIYFVENIVHRDPTQARFIKGWKNRINDFKFHN